MAQGYDSRKIKKTIMIRISDKSLCCGCTACATVCPAQCIVLRRDREGFDYPVANPDLCINCGYFFADTAAKWVDFNSLKCYCIRLTRYEYSVFLQGKDILYDAGCAFGNSMVCLCSD